MPSSESNPRQCSKDETQAMHGHQGVLKEGTRYRVGVFCFLVVVVPASNAASAEKHLLGGGHLHPDIERLRVEPHEVQQEVEHQAVQQG